MNKFVLAIALGAALVACKPKTDEATAAPATDPAASAPATDAPATTAPAADAPAATAPAAATPAIGADSGLPTECVNYLNRAKACYARANPTLAAAFQKSLDQAKAQWAGTADKAALSAQCVQADTMFSQTAAVLKCE